ncbi:hypothetical protein HU200_065563 [Digitaria exilis]|uniref:RNase H type-1 domain-containing protein n=1 Tax=Digitaria exilis TaxID=1010633 RepID=A0A835DUG1_9POAL|nr:hypothetical protein HU200_065563 [Digitaria exilis]
MKGGWGFVIRDQDGECICAGRGAVQQALEPLQVELIACLKGVKTAMEMGIGKIVVETDALMVKQAVEALSHEDCPYGGLAKEIRLLLEFDFLNARIEFRPRECNRVAHSLAVLGVECPVSVDPLLDNLPSCIQVLIASDLAVPVR